MMGVVLSKCADLEEFLLEALFACLSPRVSHY